MQRYVTKPILCNLPNGGIKQRLCILSRRAKYAGDRFLNKGHISSAHERPDSKTSKPPDLQKLEKPRRASHLQLLPQSTEINASLFREQQNHFPIHVALQSREFPPLPHSSDFFPQIIHGIARKRVQFILFRENCSKRQRFSNSYLNTEVPRLCLFNMQHRTRNSRIMVMHSCDRSYIYMQIRHPHNLHLHSITNRAAVPDLSSNFTLTFKTTGDMMIPAPKATATAAGFLNTHCC